MSFLQIYGIVGVIFLLTIRASVQSKTVKTPIDEMHFPNFPNKNDAAELHKETRLPHNDVGDVEDDFRQHKLSKRYILENVKWRIKNFTYKILSYPYDLNHTAVDNEIARAFDKWSEVTDLSFTPTSSDSPNLRIEFRGGGPGEEFIFNGPALAYAFLPQFGGDIHFNKNEKWTINGTGWSPNVFETAFHEIGHTLGLAHSDVFSAVMSANFKRKDGELNLHPDDIAGIQELYGNKTSNRNKQNLYSICKYPKIDTIFKTWNGKVYAFKNDECYKIDKDSVSEGYPKLISAEWPGLEANIDAAFTLKNKTYFFKDIRYWRYNEDRHLEKGYPRKICHDFPGLPGNFDAAMACESGQYICFFKGTEYFIFRKLKKDSVVSYNRIFHWDNFQPKLDAVMEADNGYTYFFKNDKYYTINFDLRRGDISQVVYRNSLKKLFGCN